MTDKQKQYEQAVEAAIVAMESMQPAARLFGLPPDTKISNAIDLLRSTRVVVVESKSQEKRVKAMSDYIGEFRPVCRACGREVLKNDGYKEYLEHIGCNAVDKARAEGRIAGLREAYEDAARIALLLACDGRDCGHEDCRLLRDRANAIRLRAAEIEKGEV